MCQHFLLRSQRCRTLKCTVRSADRYRAICYDAKQKNEVNVACSNFHHNSMAAWVREAANLKISIRSSRADEGSEHEGQLKRCA